MARARAGKPKAKRKATKAKSRPKAKPRAKKPAKAKPRKKPARAPSPRAPRVPSGSSSSSERDLAGALEYAAEISPIPLTLHVKSIQTTGRHRTPWMVVGRFVPRQECHYDQLYQICKTWEASLELERRVHSQRLSRMRVDYVPRNGIRQEYTVSETAPWEMMISRAVHATNPRLEDSLTARYGAENGATIVQSIYIWLSRSIATDAIVQLTQV